LRAAALELFTGRGYAATTVDDIAEAAGVTQRTFFRHFPDKEEVLFAAGERMRTVLVDALTEVLPAAAPESPGTAADAAGHAVRRLAASFEADRTQHRLRAGVLAQVPSLQARQLLKQQAWAQELVEELSGAGVPARQAEAAVALAAAALQLAYRRWLADGDGPPLTALLDAALDDLRAAAGGLRG
jgi:AcrR family transcriptional regulator